MNVVLIGGVTGLQEFNLKYVDFSELEWDRKYYEVGNFQIEINAEDYDANYDFVYRDDRREVGWIQKVTYKRDELQEYIVLSGFFLTDCLNTGVTVPTYYGTGSMLTAILNILFQYVDFGEGFSVDSSGMSLGNYDFQSTGDRVGDLIFQLLKPQECSVNVCLYKLENVPEPETEEPIFEVQIWKANDRTVETGTDAVIFSDGFGNITSVEYSKDSSNYRNVVSVGGSGEGSNRIWKTAGSPNTELDYFQTRRAFYNASSEQYDSSKQTLAQYKANLQTIGNEKLADYTTITNIEIETDDSIYKYGTDYDLGDKCDIIIDALSVSYNARIIEIDEHYSKGEESHTITFGDKIPTIYKKI